MRCIEFAIAYHGVQKVLHPNSPEDVLDPCGFTQLCDSDGELCVSTFDFNSFVVPALYGLLESRGVLLPEVVYDEVFSDMDKDERLETLEEQNDDDTQYGIEMFHEISVDHIHPSLGLKKMDAILFITRFGLRNG